MREGAPSTSSVMLARFMGGVVSLRLDSCGDADYPTFSDHPTNCEPLCHSQPTDMTSPPPLITIEQFSPAHELRAYCALAGARYTVVHSRYCGLGERLPRLTSGGVVLEEAQALAWLRKVRGGAGWVGCVRASRGARHGAES